MIGKTKWKKLVELIEWALKSDLSKVNLYIEYDWRTFIVRLNSNMECVLTRETMTLTISFREYTHEKRVAWVAFDGKTKDLNANSLYYLIAASIRNAFILYEQGVEDGQGKNI